MLRIVGHFLCTTWLFVLPIVGSGQTNVIGSPVIGAKQMQLDRATNVRKLLQENCFEADPRAIAAFKSLNAGAISAGNVRQDIPVVVPSVSMKGSPVRCGNHGQGLVALKPEEFTAAAFNLGTSELRVAKKKLETRRGDDWTTLASHLQKLENFFEIREIEQLRDEERSFALQSLTAIGREVSDAADSNNAAKAATISVALEGVYRGRADAQSSGWIIPHGTNRTKAREFRTGKEITVNYIAEKNRKVRDLYVFAIPVGIFQKCNGLKSRTDKQKEPACGSVEIATTSFALFAVGKTLDAASFLPWASYILTVRKDQDKFRLAEDLIAGNATICGQALHDHLPSAVAEVDILPPGGISLCSN